CLEKDPQRRYDSARALAEDLECWLDGKPIRARAVGALERGWRWCRRNRAVAALLAAVCASLVGGLVTAAYFAVQASSKAQQLEQALRDKAAAEQRGRSTALRLVRFLKQHPDAARLPSRKLVAAFLSDNPDLSLAHLAEAFVPDLSQAPPSG